MAKDRGNGKNETEGMMPPEGQAMWQTMGQNFFASEFLQGAKSIADAVVRANMVDPEEALIASRYFSWCVRNLPPRDIRVQIGIIKLNSTLGVKGRARNDALEANAGVFFPPDMTKEERKSYMQLQRDKQTGDRGQQADNDNGNR